jgi:hypothetical protein
VKQQEEPKPKPQVEQEKKPQDQIQVNHENGGDMGKKKKKRRRGGKRRHQMRNQDAKQVCKNQDKKKDLAHIKCYKCGDMGHFASRCPTRLEKKAQAILERQGNKEAQHRQGENAHPKRKCYSCREQGHMANSCPLGNNSKPISIDDNIVLRKDGNGTSLLAITKHPAIHTKVLPKYVAPNLEDPT